MSNFKFEKIASLDGSILIGNPDLELTRSGAKIALETPDSKLLKCFDWIRSSDQEMIALGYSSGRVLLGQISEQRMNFIQDFLPRHSRTCIDVAFCPVNPKLLATALDKVRNDCGLNVWDIGRLPTRNEFTPISITGSTDTILSNNNEKPIASYGSSEGISSMAWFNDSTTIVAGMSQKWIRLFDLRDTMSSSLIFSTRAVQGITTDPFSPHRWASFSEDGIIRVFDIRKVGDPILSFGTDYKNGIKQISWAKSRSGVIGVLGRDSPIIKIFEIQDIHNSAEVVEEANDVTLSDVPVLVTVKKGYYLWYNSVAIYENEKISCFAWDTDSQKGLANLVLLCEAAVRISIPETLCSGISPLGPLGMAVQEKFVEVNLSDMQDISDRMFQRSIKGYCLNAEVNLNILDKADKKLIGVWEWIKNMEKNAHLFVKGSKDYSREGFYSLVECSLREIDDSFSNTIDSMNKNFPFTSYNSLMRRKCLLMIGWEFYRDDPLESNYLIDMSINASMDAGKYEEAAATAFFHGLDIAKTINALMKSSEERLKLIAVSLASLENSNSSVTWKGLCGSICSELKNPFLRSIFGLIASSGDVFSVLNDKDLSLKDKLGIAFRLLDDQMLIDYLSKLMNKMMIVGEVQSIILCGLSSDSCINVLSNYLDHSGDIQTVALLSSFINEPSADSKILKWIKSYRELLDHWQQFDRRAEFDIARPKSVPSIAEEDLSRLSLRCNYCSGPILSTHYSAEISSCQKCRKPLPRCSICLINMGISINESGEPIADWFTVCISCKHGGHVSHITNWFKLHDECPIWNCSCKCGGR